MTRRRRISNNTLRLKLWRRSRNWEKYRAAVTNPSTSHHRTGKRATT
jgi:hypothetical protein